MLRIRLADPASRLSDFENLQSFEPSKNSISCVCY